MNQNNQSVNAHIEEYLNYYCQMPHAPGFAVLLKGQWGVGKTWFINNFFEELKAKKSSHSKDKNGEFILAKPSLSTEFWGSLPWQNKKSKKQIESKQRYKVGNQEYLYISLYGMSNISEIEDTFFQLLNPFWSSKGMKITGILAKGLLKGSLKIDLDRDGNDNGNWNIQVPEVNLPEHLRDVDKRVLVFDDLERCNIELSSLFGYINYFVEHQEAKVILLANEEEFKDESYTSTKEKLIGRTFNISPNLTAALTDFIVKLNDDAKKFLSNNVELIQGLYNQAEYENLRVLKQIVLDFERVFEALPKEARQNNELLQDLLKFLISFSIEIRDANLPPQQIGGLKDEYKVRIRRKFSEHRASDSSKQDDAAEQPFYMDMLKNKYPHFSQLEPFPTLLWWQTFFDKGVIDRQELSQSIANSKYYNRNTPDWVRLWHFVDLSDDEFEALLSKIESEYDNRKFANLEVIRHVFGLLLKFSDLEFYRKSREDVLEDSKLYIDYLRRNNRTVLLSYSTNEFINRSGLGFNEEGSKEFKELTSYINKVRELAEADSMPAAAQKLLGMMQNDVGRFCYSIYSSNYQSALEKGYYEVPVLKYIEPSVFVERLLLMRNEDQRHVFWGLKERYKSNILDERLIEELGWLKDVQRLLEKEVSNKQGKLSGYLLEFQNKEYLNKAIERLEVRQREKHIDQSESTQ